MLFFMKAGLNRMVSDGIIQCLVQLVLSSDVETIHSACVALCRLCITEENGKLIYESGAIPNLVKRGIITIIYNVFLSVLN